MSLLRSARCLVGARRVAQLAPGRVLEPRPQTLADAVQLRASYLVSAAAASTAWLQGHAGLHTSALLREQLGDAPATPPEPSAAVSRAVFNCARVLELRRELEALAKKNPTMPASQLEDICRDKAGADSQSSLAQALHDAGVVLRVGDQVYLEPPEVVRATLHAVQDQLDAAEGLPPAIERLAALDKIKQGLDARARTRTRLVLWAGLGYMSAQLAVFVRLTYWELSWDTMEPAGFMVMNTFGLLGQLYFLRTMTEYSHEDIQTRLVRFFQRRLYKKNGFDIELYNTLQARCL